MPQPDPHDPERSGGQSPVSILMLLPNMVTLMGMSFGLTAIRLAVEGRFAMAVFLILLATLCDGFDGLLARRLGAVSPLGAQLDSLSDFLCFGVAPAIVVYQVHLTHASGLGWIFALLFAASACLRLARFNVMAGWTDEAEDQSEKKLHFVGVPAPAGAFLGLMPAFLTLGGVLEAGSAPVPVSLWLAFVGMLMISKVKTLSPRAIKVPRRLSGLILFATVTLIGLTLTQPWHLLVAFDLAYLATVVHALVKARGRLFG